MSSSTKIEFLFKGMPTPLPHLPSVTTAMNRQGSDFLIVHKDRIEGDEVANKVHHGGPQRVLHHYPLEHYPFWEKSYPGTTFVPGSMGENLSAKGLTEKNVCIGDIYEIGELLCVVTEPRKPCGTIDQRYGVKGLARKIQEESRTGWFYRILKAGTIRPGDKIVLQDRPHPLLTIDACVQALLIRPDRSTLEIMVHNPTLSDNWKTPARNYLATGILPDDRARLGEI